MRGGAVPVKGAQADAWPDNGPAEGACPAPEPCLAQTGL